MSEIALMYPVPGGRFGMSSASPLNDGSGATIYYMPYVHDRITLWNGYGFQVAAIPATYSIDISGTTSGLGYDLFAYITPAGALAFDPPYAWTSASARVNSLQYNNGILTKMNDGTRRYMGSFYSYGGTTYDQVNSTGGVSLPGRRLLWNMYNRVQKAGYTYDTTSTWTYNSTSWRICRGVAVPNNSVEIFRGRDEDAVIVTAAITAQSTSNSTAYFCIGLNGVRQAPLVFLTPFGEASGAGNEIGCLNCSYSGQPGLGYFTFNMMETTGGSVNYGANYGGAAHLNTLSTC
jgi:hypothetical protein